MTSQAAAGRTSKAAASRLVTPMQTFQPSDRRGGLTTCGLRLFRRQRIAWTVNQDHSDADDQRCVGDIERRPLQVVDDVVIFHKMKSVTRLYIARSTMLPIAPPASSPSFLTPSHFVFGGSRYSHRPITPKQTMPIPNRK